MAQDNRQTEHQQDTSLAYELSFEKPQAAWKTLKRLWQTARAFHQRLILVLLSVTFYTILMIAAPWYSAGVIDHLWNDIQISQTLGQAFHVTWQQGGREIGILFLLYLGAWLFYSLQSYAMLSFAETLSLHLRTELSQKLNRLPLSYFDHQPTGDSLSRFTNDLDKMSEALQNGVLELFTSVGMVLGALVIMFHFQPRLTLLFGLFTLLALGVTKLFSQATLNQASARQQAMGRVTSLIEEYNSGRVILKAFSREADSSQHIHTANEALARSSEKVDFLINVVNPAIRLVNRLGQVGIALWASSLLIQGRLSVGAFQAFLQYMNQAAEPLTDASYVITSMQSALASAERVYQLLDEPELSPEPAQPPVLPTIRGKVEFRQVRFGYSPDKEIMKGVSFTVQPGQKVAIVGETGAGKTTLINLLMRFYEVQGGKILLDDVDIADLSRQQLRSYFGMVLQDTWLFEGTIGENIAYGRPDASPEEIRKAAQAARVDFFVRTLPQGYDTRLENDSEAISVGQRQLLTIARVILCNPPLLILDEATSSVDTQTEMEINRAMKTLMQDRTSFVIAHRLSTIVDADLILVMAGGNIVEQGTHQELLQQGGAYADLYNSQFAGA